MQISERAMPRAELRWELNGALLVALAAVFLLSLLAGEVWLAPGSVYRALFMHRAPDLASLIVTDLRLPRAVLACLVGGALGLSGAVLQGLTRNPLAEPGLLGVSAGAALGSVIAIYFGMTSLFELTGPLMGLAGALGASALTFALGRNGGAIALVLAGSAVSALAGACISLALNLAPNPYAAYEIMTWLMGSLSDRGWNHVQLVLPFVLVGCGLMLILGRSLDALSLGERQAESLGINLQRLNAQVILGTALAVGASTSVTGAIGFVGLVAPHLIRPLVKHQPSRILIPSALLGAILLLGADICTRLSRIGPELKIGVLTSLIGTPFFFWLVVKLRKEAP
jgi:iron complex transport system permease protein